MATASFTPRLVPRASERRDKHTHEQWKQDLRRWYNVMRPLEPGQRSKDRKIRCPILKAFYTPQCRCVAHIVPPFLDYEYVAWMLGAEADVAEGSSLVWDFRNGMMMAKALEKEFDEGVFVIVPIPTAQEEPQRFRFVLLNAAYSHQRVGELSVLRYSDLDEENWSSEAQHDPGSGFCIGTTSPRFYAPSNGDKPTGKT